MGLKPRILVVDDNEIIQSLMMDLLTQHGYEVYTVATGNDALKAMKNTQPHLLLVDLMLPDISGIEVIKKARKLAPTIESIIITGYSSYESALQVLESQSASGFLEKPIDVDKLLQTISSILTRHEAQLKIQEDLATLSRLNYQLEFFNSIFFRDFKLINKVLSESISLFESSILDFNQKKSLKMLKLLRNNNQRLIDSYIRIKEIKDISPKQFKKIDLFNVIEDVIQQLDENDLISNISIPDNYSSGKYFVLGLEQEIKEMFYELLISMIMPGILEHLQVKLEISSSNTLTDEDEQPIKTTETKLTLITPYEKQLSEDTFSEFQSQNYGLGFYIVKNLLDIFNGKIFLEDEHKDEKLITTVIVYLPAE